MTLDGHEPNKCSLGNKKFAFTCLSYSCEIVEWLEECILIANQKPLVKSVIIQYKDLLKQITHTDMDTNYSEQLLNTMLKPENVIAVGEMLSVQYDWLNRIISKYIWEPLRQFATERGLNHELLHRGEGRRAVGRRRVRRGHGRLRGGHLGGA